MALVLPQQASLHFWFDGTSLVDGGGGVASAWNDLTANNFDLTPHNSPTIVTPAEFTTDLLAANFVRASTQYFDRNAAGTPTWGGDQTTFAFINNEDHTAAATTVFFDSENGTGLSAAHFFGSGTNRPFSAFAGSSLISTFVSPFDGWALYAVNWNGASTDIYVNGIKSATTATSGAQTAEGIRLGTQRGAPGNSFDGQIAEAGAYNNVLLTATEHKELAGYMFQKYFGQAQAGGGGLRLVGHGGLAA